MIGDLLASRMQKIIRKNMEKSQKNKAVIAETIAELKLCLLEADVNQVVVDDLMTTIEQRANQEVMISRLKPSQMMIKIVHDEILKILGGATNDLNIKGRLPVILIVGLQGSGKTTSVAKMANLVAKQKSKKPLMVACDIYRPGAIDQLVDLGKQINIPVFERGTSNPVTTAQKALKYAEKNHYDLVIIDTAGRLQINEDLMNELKTIRNKIQPQEILLVVDGMVGQDIINQVTAFHKALKLTGVVITKLDGDAKGGAALSVTQLTGLPIKFIGTGEQIKNWQIFHPDRMANRILGMGDLKTLFETASEVIDARTMKVTMQRMMRGQFDLQDLLNQLKQMKKIGSLNKISRMIPGLPKISPEKIADTEEKLRVIQILISSMTVAERQNIHLLRQLNRKQRIIKGSGRSEKEYNSMINHYNRSKKQVDLMAKNIKQGRMPDFGSMKI